jgi:hypothetical protein
MEKVGSRNRLLDNGLVKLSTAVLVGSLLLTGCGRRDSDEVGPSASGSPTVVGTDLGIPDAISPRLVFDDLHGGSAIIEVYPGVTNAAADRQANGSFNDGDSVPAECKAKGRTVHSNPALGEEDRSSDDWIRIQGSPGEIQYATAVYVENPGELLRDLPDC